MKTNMSQTIYKILRIVQFVISVICVLLEFIEYSAFTRFIDEQGIPASAYFSAGITPFADGKIFYYNGIKIYLYIVILLTLMDSGLYLVRHFRFFNGPFRRDIPINMTFTVLWVTSSVSTIYPSFEGYSFLCDPAEILPKDTSYASSILSECSAKLASIVFSWINTFLFFFTFSIAYKLMSERQEMYEGERRVEALSEVHYKYTPKANLIVQVDEPEQVMIYKSFSKSEMKKGIPMLYSTASPTRNSFSN